MADNKNLNEPEEDSGDNEKKQNRKKIILLAVLGLCVVMASVGGTLLVINLLSPPPVTQMNADTADTEVKPGHDPAIYYPLKPAIIVTYNARGRQRYVQAELTLMFRDQSLVPVIEMHMPMIRHELMMIIGGQDYDELQTAEGKELTRLQCLAKIQAVLEQEIGKPGIEQVLFVGFVMQ